MDKIISINMYLTCQIDPNLVNKFYFANELSFGKQSSKLWPPKEYTCFYEVVVNLSTWSTMRRLSWRAINCRRGGRIAFVNNINLRNRVGENQCSDNSLFNFPRNIRFMCLWNLGFVVWKFTKCYSWTKILQFGKLWLIVATFLLMHKSKLE